MVEGEKQEGRKHWRGYEEEERLQPDRWAQYKDLHPPIHLPDKEALEDTKDDDINHRSDVQTKTSLVCIC